MADPRDTCETPSSLSKRFRGLRQLRSRRWWKQQIPSPALLHLLYLISFITGFLDPGTYLVFRTFASNQTGNVILLTLVAANDSVIQIHNVVASLASYLVTGCLAGQIAHRVGLRKRWWLFFSHALQAMTLVIACILDGTSTLVFDYRGTQWIFLTLLAASSGLQVAFSRNCGNGEVPTAMLSSPMIDLVTDKQLFRIAWRSDPSLKARNIRLIYIFSLIIGSFVGAYVHKYAGFLPVLAITAGGKAFVAVWLLLLKGE